MHHLRRIGLIVLLFLFLLGPLIEQRATWASPGWLTGWTYRKAITIDHTYVDSDLTSFPLYVKFTNDAEIGDHALATGYDIRFTTDDETTECYHERISWSGGGGSDASGEFFVRVPTIAGASNTTIYIYYGKADATDGSDHENTFQAVDGWVAVWHLEESGSGYLDATANNNDSTAQDAPTRVSGKVGYGQDFEYGDNNYIKVGDSTSLDIGTNDFTISFWMNAEEIPGDRFILSKYVSGAGYDVKVISAGPKIYTRMLDGTGSCIDAPNGTISTGFFYHIAWRVDRDNATGYRYFINGTMDSRAPDPTGCQLTLVNTTNFGIGVRRGGDDLGEYFDGILDEIRISNTLRSDAWLKFEYRNVYETDNEIAFGPETTDTAQFTTDVSSLDVNEGSTNVFQVKLTKAPGKTINTTVSRQSGNSHISVQSGANLTFNDGNYDSYQTVTLACETHTDQPGKEATIRVHDQASELADKDVTATEVYTAAKYWYVRPAGGSYGAENGTSYAAAWNGLTNIVFGASGINGELGDTLWVCGLHVPTYTGSNLTTFADITLDDSGADDDHRIIIRGDYPGDAGIVWGGPLLAHEAWVDEESGAYSITIPGSFYEDWFFEDVTSSSWTDLTKATSLANCQATAGSHYSATYGGTTKLYIHCSDGLAPTNRIVGNRWGHQFKMSTQSYITFQNIDFYSHYRMFLDRSASETLTHITWDNCKLIYGCDESIIAPGTGCSYLVWEDCEIAWGECGVYQISADTNWVHDFTWKNNVIHDIGVRVADSDSHAIAWQGGYNMLVEHNECYNCGHTIIPYGNNVDQPIYDNIIRYNYVHDCYPISGASTGIGWNCDNANTADKSGNECYYNIVSDAVYGIRWKYQDEGKVYNNVVYNCKYSFYIYNATYGTNCIVKNNISLSPTDYHIYMDERVAPGNYVVNSDYNIFYPISGNQFYFHDTVTTTTTNLAGWKALSKTGCTFDPHSLSSDPLFINAGGSYALDTDFIPQAGSPCINAGTDVGLTEDYAGNPLVGLPDIGAFEWQGTGGTGRVPSRVPARVPTKKGN